MVYEIKQKEFCRLTGLTRKALLIYEGAKLLTPSRIDGETGYRYYGQEQIDKGSHIALLRALNFSVVEIEELLQSGANSLELLRKKEIELSRQQIVLSQGLYFLSLHHTSAPFKERLQEITLPLYQVVAIEGRGTLRDLLGHLKQLGTTVLHYGMVPTGVMGTYYYPDSTPALYHYKVFLPVAGEWPTSIPGVMIENFGSVLFRSVRHYGSYELLPQAYKKLDALLHQEKIPFVGEYLELYHTTPHSRLMGDTATLITDVGVPQWV